MTKQNQVIKDERYTPYLDHGFVGLIDKMGSDQSVEFAARMSYGEGTRPVSDTRALIRYLVRHHHTSPLEMCEVAFHLKVPIFVMRQLVRHRTANLNEASGRYSIMPEEVYVPELERMQRQSVTNKQGSGEALDEDKARDCRWAIDYSADESLKAYKRLLDHDLTRELARSVLPTGGYTELVWKCDLKNFFHMVNLRMDSHAQWEIQELAKLMFEKVKPHYPILTEAVEDYILKGDHLSSFEVSALKKLLKGTTEDQLLDALGKKKDRMSKREINEFVGKFR